jgi:hypothetical protein
MGSFMSSVVPAGLICGLIYNNHKLSFQSTQCVFLGYNSMHKGYKCLDHATGCIYISRDVVFNESLFPFASSSPATEPVACNDHLRNYRVELMTTNVPVDGGCVFGSDGAPPTGIVPVEAPTSLGPDCSRPASHCAS